MLAHELTINKMAATDSNEVTINEAMMDNLLAINKMATSASNAASINELAITKLATNTPNEFPLTEKRINDVKPWTGAMDMSWTGAMVMDIR